MKKQLALWLITSAVAFLLAASFHLDAPPAPVRSASDACRHKPSEYGFAWTGGGHLICLQAAP